MKQNTNDNFMIKEQYSVPRDNEEVYEVMRERKDDLKILQPAKVSFRLLIYSCLFIFILFSMPLYCTLSIKTTYILKHART